MTVGSDEKVVILLRAINVGGTSKLPMAGLRDLLNGLGYTDVKTYIQSGNITAFPPPTASGPDTLARDLEVAILTTFGVTTRVITRRPAEVRAALLATPYGDHVPKLTHVSFLEKVPDDEAVGRLRARDFGEDRWELVGRDLHLRYAENTHASKLTNILIERLLETTSTARNILTVAKLVELADA